MGGDRAKHVDWSSKQVFTTGEAAELCRVSQQTIIRCFDAGRLSGFRVPGSRFRRIPRAELLRFMKENEIPTEILEGVERVRILLVDDDPAVLDLLREIVASDDRYEVHTASNGFDAGVQVKELRPALVLLDYMLPDVNGNVVCRRLRADPATADTRILIVSGAVDPAEVDTLLRDGADGFLQKPFDPDRLMDRVRSMLDSPSAGREAA